MEYMEYLELTWHYLPYMLIFYIFVTLVPKSFGRMKAFADADYKANRHKYHRCYGPELCCHALAGSAPHGKQPKARKPVTRVYPKKSASSSTILPAIAVEPMERRSSVITRQVPASSIQTFTHVNQIARMFETGHTPTTTLNPNATMHGAPVVLPGRTRKVNRVTPNTILNDMLNAGGSGSGGGGGSGGAGASDDEDYDEAAALKQLKQSLRSAASGGDWQGESGTAASGERESGGGSANRRSRPVSIQLGGGGTSATPSTSSPLSSPLSSPTSESPVRRTAPFNLQSSIEDIFAALARNAERLEQEGGGGGGDPLLLAPVTSIDDILSQRRLSRPLSAYSISDLLVGEENDVQVENFLRTLNQQA